MNRTLVLPCVLVAWSMTVIASSSRPTSTWPFEVKIPKQGWSITFDAPRLSDKHQDKKGQQFAFAANSDRFNMSLFVEMPKGPGETHKDVHAYYWPLASRNPMIAKETIVSSETERFVRVQYDIVTDFEGKPIRQKNVNYYFAFKGRWIDVHISIIAPTEEDERIFRGFDESLSYK
jgi:hypothetical protein